MLYPLCVEPNTVPGIGKQESDVTTDLKSTVTRHDETRLKTEQRAFPTIITFSSGAEHPVTRTKEPEED
jgi:hypothetical protein